MFEIESAVPKTLQVHDLCKYENKVKIVLHLNEKFLVGADPRKRKLRPKIPRCCPFN
jgi:hypothetical protein